MSKFKNYTHTQIPLAFFDEKKVDLDRMVTIEGLLSKNIEKYSTKPIISYSGLLEDVSAPIMESLVGVNPRELVNIHMLNSFEFEELIKEGSFTGYGYSKDFNWNRINAFQTKHCVFLRAGRDLFSTYVALFHEFGGSFMKFNFEQKGNLKLASPKIKSMYLVELNHYFMQHTAIVKFVVEYQKINEKYAKNLKYIAKHNSPIHFHASLNSIGILREKKSPLEIYSEEYMGKREIPSSYVPVRRKESDSNKTIWVNYDDLRLEALRERRELIVGYRPLRDIVQHYERSKF